MTHSPSGFLGMTRYLGLKDNGDDFMLITSDRPSTSSAVFTRSLFAGPSVKVSRTSSLSTLRGVVTLARNANVATGAQGIANAAEIRALCASMTGCKPEELVIASTGVIGVQYPMDQIRDRLTSSAMSLGPADFDAAATAMMTTDTVRKIRYTSCGEAMIVGIAKGVGMIEPNMATMLAYFFTDAAIPGDRLDAMFRRVIDVTFNAVSIDTDTSTSDTAVIIANGLKGSVDDQAFESALLNCALELTRDIARDGEGATKLIEVRVTGARDTDQAKRVSKAVVNSPLVKTAVHGADPNWGRVAMAIGKCQDDVDIVSERVTIAFGDQQMYPGNPTPEGLAQLRRYLSGPEVTISIGLGCGEGIFTSYGCDLSAEYVRVNASYTT